VNVSTRNHWLLLFLFPLILSSCSSAKELILDSKPQFVHDGMEVVAGEVIDKLTGKPIWSAEISPLGWYRPGFSSRTRRDGFFYTWVPVTMVDSLLVFKGGYHPATIAVDRYLDFRNEHRDSTYVVHLVPLYWIPECQSDWSHLDAVTSTTSLPKEAGSVWTYERSVYDSLGNKRAAGEVTVTFTQEPAFTGRTVLKPSIWRRATADTLFTSGPYQVLAIPQVSSANSGLTAHHWDRVWFQNAAGVFEASKYSTSYHVELILPSSPLIGSRWATGVDSGYEVSEIRTARIAGKDYPLVEIRWWHAGYQPEWHVYRWAVGYGLLELHETRLHPNGRWLESETVSYRLIRVSHPL